MNDDRPAGRVWHPARPSSWIGVELPAHGRVYGYASGLGTAVNPSAQASQRRSTVRCKRTRGRHRVGARRHWGRQPAARRHKRGGMRSWCSNCEAGRPRAWLCTDPGGARWTRPTTDLRRLSTFWRLFLLASLGRLSLSAFLRPCRLARQWLQRGRRRIIRTWSGLLRRRLILRGRGRVADRRSEGLSHPIQVFAHSGAQCLDLPDPARLQLGKSHTRRFDQDAVDDFAHLGAEYRAHHAASWEARARCSAAAANSSSEAKPASDTARQYGAGMLFNRRQGFAVLGLTPTTLASAEAPPASRMMSA